MYKQIFTVFAISFLFMLPACSEKLTEAPVELKAKGADITMHPEPKHKPGEKINLLGLAEAIKKKTLPDYPAMTIGKAFDGYSHFTKKEWKETFAENGKIYVDFIGWAETKVLDLGGGGKGIFGKGLAVKFVINQDGGFFVAMVSRVEVTTDGKISTYPLADLKFFIDSIYANKKIIF